MQERIRSAYREKLPTLLEDLKRCKSPQLLDCIYNEIVQEWCKLWRKKTPHPKTLQVVLEQRTRRIGKKEERKVQDCKGA